MASSTFTKSCQHSLLMCRLAFSLTSHSFFSLQHLGSHSISLRMWSSCPFSTIIHFFFGSQHLKINHPYARGSSCYRSQHTRWLWHRSSLLFRWGICVAKPSIRQFGEGAIARMFGDASSIIYTPAVLAVDTLSEQSKYCEIANWGTSGYIRYTKWWILRQRCASSKSKLSP